MYPFSLWLEAFLWTLAFEIPIYALFLRPLSLPLSRSLPLLFGLNLLTHPALWYLFPRFEPRLLWLLTAETWVFLTEGLALALALSLLRPSRRFGSYLWLAILAAFTANLVSTLGGLLLFADR